MRGLREQPRVAIAKALGALLLVVLGIAIGSIAGRGDGEQLKAANARLATAHASITAQTAQVRRARTQTDLAQAALKRATHRIRTLTRVNHGLRRDLRRATRARAARRNQQR